MDRLLTNKGGQPFFLGDIEYLQDNVKQNVASVLKALIEPFLFKPNANYSVGFKQDGIILSGEHIYNNGSYRCSNCWIFIKDEILPVKDIEIPFDKEKEMLAIKIVVENESERVFKDGTSHFCYQKRFVELVKVDISEEYIDEHDDEKLQEELKKIGAITWLYNNNTLEYYRRECLLKNIDIKRSFLLKGKYNLQLIYNKQEGLIKVAGVIFGRKNRPTLDTIVIKEPVDIIEKFAILGFTMKKISRFYLPLTTDKCKARLCIDRTEGISIEIENTENTDLDISVFSVFMANPLGWATDVAPERSRM